MKAKSLTVAIVSILLLGSCSDNATDNVRQPVETGEEILFGSSLPSTTQVQTRTIYGEEVTTGGEYGNGYFPVYWDNNDTIAIFCPQASNGTRVDYIITPGQGDMANTSTAVTKVPTYDAGLQWGSQAVHDFYAFYPASAAKDGKDDGVVTVNIPVEQNPVRWEKDANDPNTLVGVGNTDLAYMWAYAQVDKTQLDQGDPISLAFEPMSTILEITVNGPTSGQMTVSSINVTSVAPAGTDANTVLTGDVECDIRAAASGGKAECTAVGDMHSVRNRIYISCYNSETQSFPTLGPGQKLKVYAYLLPKDDNIDKGTLQVTVSPLNQGVKTKTLNTADVVAHAVNKVNLPALDADGTGTDVNYWMSSLNPDIYYSELSIPGSKQSAVSSYYDTGLTYYYQRTSLTQQFNLGIRAFDFKTFVDRGILGWGDPTLVVGIEQTLQGTWSSIENLVTALKELEDCLDAAEAELGEKMQESVFVNIAYSASRFMQDGIPVDDERDWITLLTETLNQYNGNRIYLDEINSETTLGDVKGKIVLRVRVNNESVFDGIETQMPAQLVCYSLPFQTEAIPMSWGTSSNANGLKLLYEEASRIKQNDTWFDISAFDGTVDSKRTQVDSILDASVALYNANNNHDTWFFIDLGGHYYNTGIGGIFSTSDTEGFTEDNMPYFFNYLQTRGQDASFGVVLLNFADNDVDYGQKFGTVNVLQTVIDNNFRFQLRTRP